MGRNSNRERILDATAALAGEGGVRAVTIEAVASRAGLTKGGVQYHFQAKDDLMVAVIDRILERWTTDVTDRAGEAPSRRARIEALVLSALATPVSFGEMHLLLDPPFRERFSAGWRAFLTGWIGDENALTPTERVALLAADGVWLRDTMQIEPMRDRQAVTARILSLIKSDS